MQRSRRRRSTALLRGQIAPAIIGWKIPASGMANASILIVHGNAGCAMTATIWHGRFMTRRRWMFSFWNIPATARVRASQQKELDRRRRGGVSIVAGRFTKYVVSESIGAGVACELARNDPARSRRTRAVCALPQSGVGGAAADVVSARLFLAVGSFRSGGMFEALSRAGEICRGRVADKSSARLPASVYLPATPARKICRSSPGRANDVSGQLPGWWREVFSFWQQNEAFQSKAP